MKRVILLSITFFLNMKLAMAQNDRMQFQRLSASDGLSQSCVIDMVQDKAGLLWLATQDGLNRYDGYSFRYFEKYFEDITAPKFSRLGRLAIDGPGDLWLISNGGVVQKRDHLTGKFHLLSQIKKASCLFSDAAGNIWVGTVGNGVYQYDVRTKSFRFFTISDDIYDFLQISDSRFLIASGNRIMEINLKAKTLKRIPVQADTITSFSSIKQDKEGNIWCGTHSGGLFVKMKEDSSFRKFKGLGNSSVVWPTLYTLDLHIDRHNRIWVATYGQGLVVIDQKEGKIDQYLQNDRDDHSISYNDILCLYEDMAGTMWMGTDGGGVSYLDNQNITFNVRTESQVPANIAVQQIRSFAQDNQGQVWLGTSGKGLTVFNPKISSWKTYRAKPGSNKTVNNDRVLALMYDAAHELLWVGTQGGGLNLLDLKKGNFSVASNIPSSEITCLFTDNAGRYWVGTRQAGLCQYDPETGRVWQYTPTNSGIKSTSITSIVQGEGGHIWIGHEYAGIDLFDTNKRRSVAFSYSGAGNQLSTQEIKCLAYDKVRKLLWVGTKGKGMDAYDGQKFHHFTTDDGLPNNMVYGIVIDNSNNLWLSTNKGISQFIPARSKMNTSKPTIINYVERDGLQYHEFNTGAYFKGGNGTIFLGGIKGFNWFLPHGTLKNNLGESQMIIDRLLVYGKEIKTDTTMENKHQLRLDFTQSAIKIGYANSYLTAKKVYQYRFDDQEWIDTQLNFAELHNLKPGEYLFQVRLKQAPQVLRTLLIMMPPPIWKTWWFLLVTVFVFGLILYSFYRIQVARRTLQYRLESRDAIIQRNQAEFLEAEATFKQKIAESEVNALRSQMNPHFIFNCLNSIKYYTMENDSRSASEYLTKFSRLIRLVLENSRSEKVTLEQELETLLLYSDMEIMRFKDKVSVELHVSPEIDQLFIEIPPLLLQPFVENAIWHGLMHKEEGGTVCVEVTMPSEKMLHVEVIDNGVGRKRSALYKSKTAMVNKSFGMKVTNERIEAINQKYRTNTKVKISDLEDATGQSLGTRVVIDIPV